MENSLERYRRLIQEAKARTLVQESPANTVLEQQPEESEENENEMSESNGMSVQEALKIFGYDSFREGQEAVVNEVLSGKDGVLAVFETGFGKCLGGDVDVLMFDGTVKNVKDVRVGDKLIGPDSKPRTVLNTTRGYGDLYEVIPNKGNPYVVNGEHILSLRMTEKKYCGKLTTIPAKEWANMRPHFKHLWKGWRTGVEFQERDLEHLVTPYFLGLWLGDGTSCGESITTADKEIKKFVRSYANGLGLNIRMANKQNNLASTLYLTNGRLGGGIGHHSNPLLTALRGLGVINNKHIPQNYLANSRQNRLSLLAGIIDSDGYCKSGCCEMCFKSEELAKDVVFLSRSLGFATYCKKVKKICCNNGKIGNYFRIGISGDMTDVPVLLKRKKCIKRKINKNPMNVGIDVKPHGKGDYYGFMLDGDHLFLLGDFTVTHNSLIYQLPPLITGKLTVVVSPLISLMRDQVCKLQGLGINAVFINSTVPMADVKMALMEIKTGGVKALYVAPERFGNKDFIQALSGIKIDVFAIDEAHCISRYGHDFRPAYAELGNVIETLNPRQVIALTATATVEVQNDICRMLGIEKATRFIRGVYRKNLRFMVFEGLGTNRSNQMASTVKQLVDNGQKTGLIYVPTRKEAELLCSDFEAKGIEANFYHAGLKDSERSSVQDKWAKEGGVIVATCAFGMGIDRPDVRFVIHSGLSQSIEDIVQECGRAGRDGEQSLCISFWDMAIDYRTQMFLIDLTTPCGQDVEKFWKWMSQTAKAVATPGAETTEINMTQKTMGELSKCVNVGGCIAFLKDQEIVETLGRGKYKFNLNKTLGSTSGLDAIRKDKIDKLNKVISFYTYKGCRMEYICGYFGDLSFNGYCGTCDNCSKK